MSTEIKRPLDIVERSMEALFGLIMVLTFTGPGRLEARGLQPLPDLGAGISLDSIVLPWDGQL